MSDFNFSQSNSRFSIEPKNNDNTGRGATLPTRLKDFDQWLATYDYPWNDARHKSARCPSDGWNSGDLLSFEDANQYVQETPDTAIAFCFVETDPFVGIDLDDVIQNGSPSDEAREIINQINSYTETSTSGNGLHVIAEAEGEQFADSLHRADLADIGHVEMYSSDRYFVLTGNVFDTQGSVEKRPDAIQQIQEEYLSSTQHRPSGDQQTEFSDRDYTDETKHVTPEDVYRTIKMYVEYGNTKHKVLRLWNGNDEDYPSTSEADMAFVGHLYFWCKGDPRLIDDCVRASDRYRDKWDTIHFQNGDTYGERTIQKVLRQNDTEFEDDYIE